MTGVVSWAQAHDAMMDGQAAAREQWSDPNHALDDHWVSTFAGGPGVVYLFHQFTCLHPYEPTEQDRNATDWVVF